MALPFGMALSGLPCRTSACPHLNPDVMCAIMGYADRDTLKALRTVSRTMRICADKELYKWVIGGVEFEELLGPQVLGELQAAEILPTNVPPVTTALFGKMFADRAGLVRHVLLEYWSGTKLFTRIMQLGGENLFCNVKTLNVCGPDWDWATSIPPNLSSFALSYRNNGGEVCQTNFSGPASPTTLIDHLSLSANNLKRISFILPPDLGIDGWDDPTSPGRLALEALRRLEHATFSTYLDAHWPAQVSVTDLKLVNGEVVSVTAAGFKMRQWSLEREYRTAEYFELASRWRHESELPWWIDVDDSEQEESMPSSAPSPPPEPLSWRWWLGPSAWVNDLRWQYMTLSFRLRRLFRRENSLNDW